MNILLVGHSAGYGGAEQALLNLAQHLLRLGHRASVIVPDAEGESVTRFASMGIDCHSMPMRHAAPTTSMAVVQTALMEIKDIVRSVSGSEFDLVLSNTTVLLHGGLLAASMKIPHIVYNHELLDGDPALKPRGLPLKGYMELLCSLTDHMLCCSQAVMQHVQAHVPEMRCTVLPPYLSEDGCCKLDSLSAKGGVQLIVIGVQSIRKNPAFALTVQRALELRGLSSQLHFFGAEASQTSKLHTLLARRRAGSRILFHGQVSDPYARLSGRVINLICSDSEPYGLTVPESLARGIPVLSTRSGGPDDMLGEEWLYDMGNLSECVHKLEAIVADYDAASNNAVARFAELATGLNASHQAEILGQALHDAVACYRDKQPPAPYTGQDMRRALTLEALTCAEILENIADVAAWTPEEVQRRYAEEVKTPGYSVSQDCLQFDVVPHATSSQLDTLYREGLGFALELVTTYSDTGRLAMAAFFLTRLLYERRLRGRGLRILTLGDGIGTDTMRLASMGFDVDYIDYDGSRTAKVAQRNFATFGAKQLDGCGDIRVIAGAPQHNAYDAIICLEVIEHVADPRSLLNDVAAYATEDALIFISECFDGIERQWPTHLLCNEVLSGLLPLLAPEVGLYLEDCNTAPLAKPYLFRKGQRNALPLQDMLIKEGLMQNVLQAQARIGGADASRPETTIMRRADYFPDNQQPESKRVYLYQIAYSDETWNSIPAGLLPLDNRSNERPDWAEYWPIRRFLLNEALDENAFYGFLSPRFTDKLGASPNELLEFVSSVADDVDVATFSPFFDLAALFRNVFEHGEYHHPGFMDLSRNVLQEVAPHVDVYELVNTSKDTIFCNYFAAKPRFWREWLALCEQVFAMAESPDHPLASSLNRGHFHRDNRMPAKVFVIERIASLLLATTDSMKIENFHKSSLSPFFGELPYTLLMNLDNLKVQSAQEYPLLLNAFCHIQHEILTAPEVIKARSWILTENLARGGSSASSKGYEHWGGDASASRDAPDKIGMRWLLRRLLGLR